MSQTDRQTDRHTNSKHNISPLPWHRQQKVIMLYSIIADGTRCFTGRMALHLVQHTALNIVFKNVEKPRIKSQVFVQRHETFPRHGFIFDAVLNKFCQTTLIQLFTLVDIIEQLQ